MQANVVKFKSGEPKVASSEPTRRRSVPHAVQSVLGLIHFHHVLRSSHPFHRRTSLGVRRFGEQTLLEWLVSRVSEAEHLDHLGILWPEGCDPAVAARISPRVHIFPQRGPGHIGDFAAAVAECQADAVVLVGIERPLIDPQLVDELILSAHTTGADYAVFQSRPECRPGKSGRHEGAVREAQTPEPSATTCDPVGVAAEWCSRTALEVSVHEHPQCLDCRRSWIEWLSQQPERFNVQQFHLPPALDRHDLRLVIENAEDWEHAHMIYEALGPEHLDWPRVTRLLDQHPEIRQRMARLNDAELGVARPHLAGQPTVAVR